MKKAVVFTLLIESSPQALPLGAACISSSLKAAKSLEGKLSVSLKKISMEDEGFLNTNENSKSVLGAGESRIEGRSEVDFEESRKVSFCLSKILEDGKPDFVLFSIYVWNRKILCEVSRALKEKYPDVIVIAGGPEVTSSPETFTEFDYVISGQGEEASVQLIESLVINKDVPSSKTASSKIIYGKVEDLSTLVSPYLSGEIDLSEYGGALWELARGCPFKCSYCYESKGEKKIRYFPLERLEKELELFSQKKVRQVFVLDPTYNADKKRAVSMLNLISKKAPGIFFYFEARAEFIDREMAKAFSKVNCALQFGLQSADPEVLKLVRRGLDRKVFSRNISYLNETGVVFGFDLIYGLPGDTLEGFRRSIDFALKLYPNNLETFCLSVLPGTTLNDEASSLGLEWLHEPPYHVTKTDKFSKKDMLQASNLSAAVSFFYNQARAVPWFNSLCYFLKKRPSIFLENFSSWAIQKNINLSKMNSCECSHIEFEKICVSYVMETLKARGANDKVQKSVRSIMLLNGAISRTEESGKEEKVRLDFHPDDVMSEASLDIQYFSKYARAFPCTVRTFISNVKGGGTEVCWKVCK